MIEEQLGLIITPDHEDTINALAQVPAAFCAAAGDVPDEWQSPIKPWHQGATSSCAGHAGAANFTHRQFVETGELVRYSPWFSYLSAQKRGGFFGRDGGTSIKSVIDAATLDGCCLESLCPRPNHYVTTLLPDALNDAAQHKHLGAAVDLRDWETMLSWLFDRRSVVIGTTWYSGQANVENVEMLSQARGGSFRGYHARALIGWRKLDGGASPVVLNSHGKEWGQNGRALIARETWEWWRKNANFVALGFTDITERLPKRRDWSQFAWLGGGKGAIV
jgi:hypothetical protein